MGVPFRDRAEAGRELAGKLKEYAGRQNVIVLALPRGGVPVAAEIARILNAPLDVFLVRKLGVPGQEELAMGAIASGGVQVANRDVVEALGLSEDELEAVAAKERVELARREREYRDARPAPEVRDRIVILVDDGLATGSTMRAAVAALREQQPARIVVAVPVAAVSTCNELRAKVEEMVCLATPEPFLAVGLWYADFAPPSQSEIHELLGRTRREAVNRNK